MRRDKRRRSSAEPTLRLPESRDRARRIRKQTGDRDRDDTARRDPGDKQRAFRATAPN